MAARNVTVIGLQWGDEGKGKLVDALAASCKYVVRYCGGANAGHTVTVGKKQFALHLIPSGILHEDVCNVVGNGVAFDPAEAWEEIIALRARGVAVGNRNLCISSAAHLVMPYHKLEDSLSERSLGTAKIGTTARGIGPCYAEKASRSTAIRLGELRRPDEFRRKLRQIVGVKNKILAALYEAEPLDAEAVAEEYIEYGRRLEPMICNTGALLRGTRQRGERILFEGGQGSMLDVDHGTYPFVTSSAVTACGVPSGAGVPPEAVGDVLGVVKAYTSRVGAGPFPTEQDNETGEYLRQHGHEYGTTTGRARRCGWLDAAAVRYAAELSGACELALTLFDVLSGLDELKICTGYRIGQKELEDFDPDAMAEARCIYESLPGWDSDISGCRKFEELPPQARDYVNRIEQLVARPVGFISVGPERKQTIVHQTRIEGIS